MQIVGLQQIEHETNDKEQIISDAILFGEKSISISFTILNIGSEHIDWEIRAASQSDMSDERVLQSWKTLIPSDESYFSVANPPSLYYAVYIKNTLTGRNGKIHLSGVKKK